jgi:hypothetical protein
LLFLFLPRRAEEQTWANKNGKENSLQEENRMSIEIYSEEAEKVAIS